MTKQDITDTIAQAIYRLGKGDEAGCLDRLRAAQRMLEQYMEEKSAKSTVRSH